MENLMKKLRNRKGFTLVEVIIVLVILAILAAVLIPSLTGYIDEANKKAVVTECRSMVTAAQTVASEAYAAKKCATTDDLKDFAIAGKDNYIESVKELGEAPKDAWKIDVTVSKNGKISKLVLSDGAYTCTYENGAYTVADKYAEAGDTVVVK